MHLVSGQALSAGHRQTRRMSVPPPLVAVLAAGLALVLALAPGPAALAGKGAHVSEVECGILLPGILPEGQVLSTTGRLTIEPSGTATLVCHAQLAGEHADLAPARMIILTDVDCALGEGGQVAESRTVVRPNGDVTLTCHNNPGSEPFVPGDD
jgi:hypothetical protein